MNASTTLNQLTQSDNGINRLRAMVGGVDFVSDTNSVQFGFKSCRKANKVLITLEPWDTYTVEFFKFNRRSLACPMVRRFVNVHAGDLMSIFEDFTGLFLKLA